MNALEALADFIAHMRAGDAPQSVKDKLRLHLFDTILALGIGLTTEEGKAVTKLMESSGISLRPRSTTVSQTPVFVKALHWSAATRCTEIDDIHLESCTTPGSVIVSSALAMAEWREDHSVETFLSALLAGYESMIRFGKAANGPEILYKGIWPTGLAAGLGAAATAARFMGLSTEQTGNALAAALALVPTMDGRAAGPVAHRWLKLGCAVQDGILAALGSSAGFCSGLDILDRPGQVQTCIAVDQGKLLEGLGKSYEFDRISIKPYFSAKQATGAIYGFLEILDHQGINPDDISKVTVGVPSFYAGMIGTPGQPQGRMQSIISAAYQLALAAKHRAELRDVRRLKIHQEPEFQALLDKVHVEVDKELESVYPAAWPASVKVETDTGHFERKIHHAKGDPTNPFYWDEIIEKAEEAGQAIFSREGWNSLAGLCRGLGKDANISGLLEAFHEMYAVAYHG